MIKPLLDNSCVLIFSDADTALVSPTQYSIHTGEWLYCDSTSLSHISSQLYFPPKGTKDSSLLLGIDLDKTKNAKQIIRRKVRHIHGCRMYPDNITVGEELDINFTLADNDDRTDFNDVLTQFDISMTEFCDNLKYSQKIILDMLIAIYSNVTILILEHVIDSISVDYRSMIMDIVYHKSIVEGLSVVISTDNAEVKNNYLGRELSK